MKLFSPPPPTQDFSIDYTLRTECKIILNHLNIVFYKLTVVFYCQPAYGLREVIHLSDFLALSLRPQRFTVERPVDQPYKNPH